MIHTGTHTHARTHTHTHAHTHAHTHTHTHAHTHTHTHTLVRQVVHTYSLAYPDAEVKSPHWSDAAAVEACCCVGCAGAKADMSPKTSVGGRGFCWVVMTLLPALGDNPPLPGGGASLGAPPPPGGEMNPMFPPGYRQTPNILVIQCLYVELEGCYSRYGLPVPRNESWDT